MRRSAADRSRSGRGRAGLLDQASDGGRELGAVLLSVGEALGVDHEAYLGARGDRVVEADALDEALCFSSYPSGAFTCGEIKDNGPLVELTGLKQMSTYAMVGNGFAYVPDELEWPGLAPHSLIGSATPLKGIYAYRCDKDGIPIFETGEVFVNGDTHNVSIDPVAGDILVSALKAYVPPGDVQVKRLLLVRPRTLIAN